MCYSNSRKYKKEHENKRGMMKVMREADMEGEEREKNKEWERYLQQKYITYIYGNIINLFL